MDPIPNYLEIIVKWHKTVAKTGPLVKRSYASFGGALCIIAVTLHWLKCSPCDPSTAAYTPFFYWPDGSPLTQRQFRAWLQTSLTSIGVNATLHNTHSLRQGGASALAALGVPRHVVKIIGRWIDDSMPDLYTSTTCSLLRQHQSNMGRLTDLVFMSK